MCRMDVGLANRSVCSLIFLELCIYFKTPEEIIMKWYSLCLPGIFLFCYFSFFFFFCILELPARAIILLPEECPLLFPLGILVTRYFSFCLSENDFVFIFERYFAGYRIEVNGGNFLLAHWEYSPIICGCFYCCWGLGCLTHCCSSDTVCFSSSFPALSCF